MVERLAFWKSYPAVTRFVAALFFCVFLLCVFVADRAQAGDDWQLWNEVKFSVPITPQVDFDTDVDLRFKDDCSRFSEFFPQPGIRWKPFSFMYLKPGYRFIISKDNNQHTVNENRPMFDVGLHHEFFSFKLFYRYRMAYRMIEHKGGFWRFRNLFGCERKIAPFGFEITPYVSEEFFYEREANKVNQNRVKIGIKRKLFKYTTLDIYYLLRSKRSNSDWHEDHVTGVTVGFRF